MKKSNLFLFVIFVDVLVATGLYLSPNFSTDFNEVQPFWFVPLLACVPAIFLYFRAKKEETKIE